MNTMDDPWKYLAFIVSGVGAGFMSSFTASSFSDMLGLGLMPTKALIMGATGLFAGFFVDEMLPAYIKHVRSGGGGGMGGGDDLGGGDDFGGGGDDDFDI